MAIKDAAPTAVEDESQSIWAKLKGEDEDWTTDEVLTVLHWLRQGLGVVTGIALGVSGVVGSSGNIGYGECCY